MIKNISRITIISLLFFSCGNKEINAETPEKQKSADSNVVIDDVPVPYEENGVKTIHVFVALCDNRYQGIVPVPAAIGNGQNHNTNLYWGAAYGIRTYFKKSNEWKLLASRAVDDVILERLIFKHAAKEYYLIADAYDGRYIRQCTIDFLNGGSGKHKDTLRLDDKILGIGGYASLLAYIGHDGLMDFQLSETFSNADGKKRDVIVLACYSKRFFGPHLEAANVNPLLWTTHLMAPEAYTLHDALTGYVGGESNEQIRERAAAAYARYQKCSLKAAKGLLVTDWGKREEKQNYRKVIDFTVD